MYTKQSFGNSAPTPSGGNLMYQTEILFFLPIDVALWLFPIYVNDNEMCEELFAFFHTVLDVLKSQMGADAIEATIGTFINVFNKDQLTQVIVNEGSAGE